MGQGGVACPKPEKGYYKRLKAGRKREHRKVVQEVRPAVFARAGDWCECCRVRLAQSMHEDKTRGAGGKVSLTNSYAVCGSGTTGCHGHLQRKNIKIHRDDEGRAVFTAVRPVAERWMRGDNT